MLLNGLRERAEDDALLGELLAKRCEDRYRVVHWSMASERVSERERERERVWKEWGGYQYAY